MSYKDILLTYFGTVFSKCSIRMPQGKFELRKAVVWEAVATY